MTHPSGQSRALRTAVLLYLALGLAACNPIENESQSASVLVLNSLTGLDVQGAVSNFLASDVVRVDPVTKARSWRADAAQATLAVMPLDPAPILGTSPYYDVVVTRYIITFVRSDGRNVPGRDVPYGFEGSMSLRIAVNGTATASFVVVREVAKQEPPLLGLYDGTPDEVLNITAKIEFYGHDLANRAVKATGYLAVTFANFVDL